MINSETTESVSPLEKAIRDCPNIEARPDLILRLVDLLFLLVPPENDHPC